MKVYRNFAGMKVGWRHLGALFSSATIKKAYPLLCRYEASFKKKINVPIKKDLFAVAFACTRKSKLMKGRILLEVPSLSAQAERWLAGALYYLLSERCKRIHVVSDQQLRNFPSQGSCALNNTRPHWPEAEERPELRAEDDEYMLILRAEDLLVNQLCCVAHVENCIAITSHKLHAFERGHLEHYGFRMLDSGLAGKRDRHDQDDMLKVRIAALHFRFACMLEAYNRA